MIPSLNDLHIVELERLVLHEAHDSDRLKLLGERIKKEGVQRHPVIVSPRGDGYLVLDGAHRVQALKNLGCKFVLVQQTAPPEKAESWGHLLRTPGRSRLQEMKEVEVSERPSDSWLAEVEFDDGKRVFVKPVAPGLPGEVECLWGLQRLYPGDGVVHRVDPEASVDPAKGETVIRYRPFTPEELVEVVRSGDVLPAGITRFRIRERILGVRFPLGELEDGVLEERNAGLRALIEDHWRENRVRYYGEPVVLFE